MIWVFYFKEFSVTGIEFHNKNKIQPKGFKYRLKINKEM